MIEYELFLPTECNEKWLYSFLLETDGCLIPSLSSRVDLKEFSSKISKLATHYIAVVDERLAGIASFYFNKAPKFSYLTYLCVHPSYRGLGIGKNLVAKSLSFSEEYGAAGYSAVMRKSNILLLEFYKSFGFEVVSEGFYPGTDIAELHIEKKF